MSLIHLIILSIVCFIFIFLTVLSSEIMDNTESMLIRSLTFAAFCVLIFIDIILGIYSFGCVLVFFSEL